jgi:hypothetical protein
LDRPTTREGRSITQSRSRAIKAASPSRLVRENSVGASRCHHLLEARSVGIGIHRRRETLCAGDLLQQERLIPRHRVISLRPLPLYQCASRYPVTSCSFLDGKVRQHAASSTYTLLHISIGTSETAPS